MNKSIGILLVVGGLALGYFGLQNFDKSTNSAEILGVEIQANDEGGQQVGVIQLILGVLLFGGGIGIIKKK